MNKGTVEKLNEIVVQMYGAVGPDVLFILVSNCVSNIDILMDLGVSKHEIEQAERFAPKLMNGTMLNIQWIVPRYTDAKWFHQEKNQFVAYRYEERFEHPQYHPYEETVSADEREQLPTDTQQLLSFMTSYTALCAFVADERERVSNSANEQSINRYVNDLLHRKHVEDAILSNIYRSDYSNRPLLAYLDRDRKHTVVSPEDILIMHEVLNAYLAISDVLQQTGMYNAPVNMHLNRHEEVRSFLKAVDVEATNV